MTETLRILLVDDDDAELELWEKGLRRVAPNLRIKCVGSGQEAIRYLMGEGPFADRVACPYPTLILCDLKMPQGDGFEVLHHLKANPAWAVIPTIIMSGSADPDDINSAYQLGASSFLVKPTSFDDLCALLKALLNFWSLSQIPVVDASGRHLKTLAEFKLGAKYVNGIQKRYQTERPPKDAAQPP